HFFYQGSSCCFLQFYRIAEILQTIYIVFHNLVFFSAIQIVIAKFFVRSPSFQNVISHNQYLVANGNQCPFLPTSSDKAVIFSTKVSVFHLCCSPGTLGQYRPQVFIAVGCFAAFFLPALSLFPGLIPAHADKCPSDGKTFISAPISAKITDDPCSFTPGMLFNNSLLS